MHPTPDDVRAAAGRLDGTTRRTPVVEVDGSDLGVTGTLVMKLEMLQHSGSFKARGATNALLSLDIGPAGVVAASGGNHGIAVAWAAQRLGHTATIFVPTISSPAKVERLRSYGALVHQIGSVYAESLEACEGHRRETGAQSVHAYDDPAVMAGAGTCGFELEDQAGRLDSVLVACGGGGLAGGMASFLEDRVSMIVCETEGTPAYAAAVAAGGPVDVDVSGAAADALGASRLGSRPWSALSTVGADSAVVSDEQLLAARDLLWERLRIVVEPSAAAPVAALVNRVHVPARDERVGVVLCGANVALT